MPHPLGPITLAALCLHVAACVPLVRAVDGEAELGKRAAAKARGPRVPGRATPDVAGRVRTTELRWVASEERLDEPSRAGWGASSRQAVEAAAPAIGGATLARAAEALDSSETSTVQQAAPWAVASEALAVAKLGALASRLEEVGSGAASVSQGDEPMAASVDDASLRARLEQQGIAFTASLWLDAHRVARGGLERGSLLNSYLDVSATFDLEALAGWENALVFANAYATNGRNASDLAGDWQMLSNTANGRHIEQLAQLFYEQTFADGAWRIKLGKADVNIDFAAVSHGLEFVHSSAGVSPTIFALPTYPEPSTGGALYWQPSEHFAASFGVYDGAMSAGFHTGSRGPSTLFGKPSDLFTIGEGNASWGVGAEELAGRLALGTWHHDGDFARFDGGNEEGTGGDYAILEQELARMDGACIASFAQWGDADAAVAKVDQHLAAGVVATGCFERPDDAFGVYWSRVRFSEDLATSAGHETALELFYRWQAQPWLALKPDVQWIANPSGDASLDDALVFTLRLHADF